MKNIFITILVLALGASQAFADLESLGEYDKVQSTVSLGLSFVDKDKVTGRAAEYSFQEDSATASFSVRGGANDKHVIVEGTFLNENDFAFSGHFDHNNAQRLDLRIEKMFHNLDHLDYTSRPDAAYTGNIYSAGLPTGSTRTSTRGTFSDLSPADEYSLDISTYEAKFRSRLPDMPSHVTVGYWQFHKEGKKQMRFVDENCAGACHLQSKTRQIDRTVHQVSGGFDAHLGKFDVIVDHVYRELVVDDPVPTDYFAAHSRFRSADDAVVGGGPGAGVYEHDADPESVTNETTLKLHSSFAGGLNLAASGTLGNRKNKSKVTGVSPIMAEVDYVKAAADVNHVPSGRFSYNFKARYLDLDNDNTSPLQLDPFVYDGLGNPEPENLVDVRESMDIERSSYELNMMYRPQKSLTLKGNIGLEYIKRTETGPADYAHSSGPNPDNGTNLPPFTGPTLDYDPYWELPGEELITRAKVGFNVRPAGNYKFKVNGHYLYKHSDDPAYGASFDDYQELFISTSYALNPNWGFMASAKASVDSLDDHIHEVLESDHVTVQEVPIDRERSTVIFNVGTWFNTTNNVATTFNYGYNKTDIKQDLMYGVSPDNMAASQAPGTWDGNYIIVADNVDMEQVAQTLNGTITFAFGGNVKALLGVNYALNKAFYDPDFPTRTVYYQSGPTTIEATASADGLKEITQFEIEQLGGNLALEYYLTPDLELMLGYTYAEYDEKYTDLFDGSVQTATSSLSYRF